MKLQETVTALRELLNLVPTSAERQELMRLWERACLRRQTVTLPPALEAAFGAGVLVITAFLAESGALTWVSLLLKQLKGGRADGTSN